jgi:hypothetical protein
MQLSDGTPDAADARTMNVNRKHIQNVIKGVISALPAAMPIVIRRRRPSLAPYILGGLGFAIAGGAIAVMLLSPRTRKRALLVAKDTYGKMNAKVGHLRQSVPNGIAGPSGIVDPKDYGATSGL